MRPQELLVFSSIFHVETSGRKHVATSLTKGRNIRAGKPDEDSAAGYTNECRSHFTSNVVPELRTKLQSPVHRDQAWETLEQVTQLLSQAQALYLRSADEQIDLAVTVSRAKAGITESQEDAREHFTAAVWKFRKDLHLMFLQALPEQRFYKTLSYVLFDAGCQIFHLETKESTSARPENMVMTKKRLVQLARRIQEVGLGGKAAQRAFATAIDKLMDEFIGSHYMKVDWYGKKSVTSKLREWVNEGLAPFVKMVRECFIDEEERSKRDYSPFGATEIQKWEEMVIGRLGRSRVDNLFDYIVHWNRSIGAILDLKEYITTNADRAHLVVSFIGQLHRRLLRAGTTTTHILDVYIYVIRAFKELDLRGVLLERVAVPIRRYLKDRTDTGRIIVSSLLADIQDEDGNKIDPGGDISVEIAAEMFKPIIPNANEHDDELNWGDMNWTPEPADASIEYKNSKSNDVISYLLTLFDREDLISELKTILGEHLLTNSTADFEKEIRLLELFKLRLGDASLQACEVMLHDVLESQRLNNHIIKTSRDMPVRSQILSSFFWPALRDDTFKIPPVIEESQATFAKGFEAIKDMRKLHWLPALGKVEVSLELQDRTVEVECSTWQASVIYAFERGKDEPQRVGGVLRTVAQLEEALEMEEALVRNALSYWVGERVLAPHSSEADTYIVLERLSSSGVVSYAEAEAAKEEAAMEAPPGGGGVVTAENLLERNRTLYETFIQGMLTNQGGMTRQRILMMLKMAVPGGFPGGVEEVGEVLQVMKDGGKVQKGGGDVWVVLTK